MPAECPNCGGDAKTHLYKVENEFGLTEQANCRNCGWYDDIQTDLGEGVTTVRNVTIGVGLAAAAWKLLNELSKPK